MVPWLGTRARGRLDIVWWVQEGVPQDVTISVGPERWRGMVCGEANLSGTAHCVCKGPEHGPFQNFKKPVWPEHSEGGGRGEEAYQVSKAGDSGWAWTTLKI